MVRWWVYDALHEGISQTHHSNDKNIHAQWKPNNKHIKMRQPLVFCQPVYNEIHTNNVYEVKVQACIDDEIYDFLASVPPLVDVDVSVWYLKTRWNPDAIDGNIDGCYEDSHNDL